MSKWKFRWFQVSLIFMAGSAVIIAIYCAILSVIFALYAAIYEITCK